MDGAVSFPSIPEDPWRKTLYDLERYEEWLDDEPRVRRTGRKPRRGPIDPADASEDGDSPDQAWIGEFIDEGLISGVIRAIKSGKEAAVHLCRGHPDREPALLAAKIHHPRRTRGFQNDAMYSHGRVILNGQLRRAVLGKSGFGRQVEAAMWIAREYEHLTLLHSAGADVARPVKLGAWGLLMDFYGDEEAPAPQLKDVRLDPPAARRMFDRLLSNVELMLSHHVVHADLSPYNVLVWEGSPVIIDMPQAVDARTNRNAHMLLERDIDHLCRYFARNGIDRDPRRLADSLWNRYLFAKL
jgi:RIO kinase 1